MLVGRRPSAVGLPPLPGTGLPFPSDLWEFERLRMNLWNSEAKHLEFLSARLLAGETEEPFWTDGRSTLGRRRHEAHFAGRNIGTSERVVFQCDFFRLRTRNFNCANAHRTMECWTILSPWVSPIVPGSRRLHFDRSWVLDQISSAINWGYMMNLELHEDWHCAQCLLAVCKAEPGAPWRQKKLLREMVTEWHQSSGFDSKADSDIFWFFWLFWGFFFLDEFALTLIHLSI